MRTLRRSSVLGSAGALRMYAVGGVLGISGITGGLVKGKHGELDRIVFVAGLLAGGLAGLAVVPGHFRPFAESYSMYRALLAGAAVGFGTGLGTGCTSGHGIGGLSRYSPRSLAAVMTFMITGAIAASATSAAAGAGEAAPLGAAPTHGGVLTGVAAAAALLATALFAARFGGRRDGMISALDPTDPAGLRLLAEAKKDRQGAAVFLRAGRIGVVRALVEFLTAAAFALGLAVSGMTDPYKVAAFLDLSGLPAGAYAGSNLALAFVMGGAVAVATPIFQLIVRPKIERCGLRDALERQAVEACDCCAPLAEKYEIPATHHSWRDSRLIVGSAVFGVGWGMGGICPGPGIVALSVRCTSLPPARSSERRGLQCCVHAPGLGAELIANGSRWQGVGAGRGSIAVIAAWVSMFFAGQYLRWMAA